MSFQGDVGGIALADLLQSMARGREGVLKLNAQQGHKLTLGFSAGLLHLLPEENEEPEMWRTRARQAWTQVPEVRINQLSMAQIARAQRIDNLFSLLDSEGVHFRFAPGAVPRSNDRAAQVQPGESGQNPASATTAAVYVPPMPIEALLLEYARLCDEGNGQRGWRSLPAHLVLVALVDARQAPEFGTFLQECTGDYTLGEIADRLGWPLRQARISAAATLNAGLVRSASREELLTSVQTELLQTNQDRAAARLSAWLDASPAGTVGELDLAVLGAEWAAERLQRLLTRMGEAPARRLVQRLANAAGEPVRAIELWAELARQNPGDSLVALHLIAAQVRAGVDPKVPSFDTLIEVARGFSAANQRLRASALLRVAATRVGKNMDTHLELGVLFLKSGSAQEASAWILGAGKHFLDRKQPERVLDALRQLTELTPGNTDARRLYNRARAQAVRGKLVRKNSLITMGVVLVLSVAAVVQYQGSRVRSQAISEIREQYDDPHVALALFEQHFPGPVDGELEVLRADLEARKHARELSLRNSWMEYFRTTQVACNVDDALEGLARAIQLPPPPAVLANKEAWPPRAQLFDGLIARVEKSFTALGPLDASIEAALGPEKELAEQIRALRARISEAPKADDLTLLDTRLQGLSKNLEQRGRNRESERLARAQAALLGQQNILYNTARSHVEAGDPERALASFDQLLATGLSSTIEGPIRAQRESSRLQVEALALTRELCLAGKHEEARAILESNPELPQDRPMPMRLDSRPSGAKVTFADGLERVTPLDIEASLFTPLSFTLELENHDSVQLKNELARSLVVPLPRSKAFHWKAYGRVEAEPLFLGSRAILVDRAGGVACVENDRLVWEKRLPSLGGFAKAPVLLPSQPERLCLVSEDGEVWLLALSDGSHELAWKGTSSLRRGPLLQAERAWFQLRDGSLWTLGSSGAPELAPEGSTWPAQPPTAAWRQSEGIERAQLRQRELEFRVGSEHYELMELRSSEVQLRFARQGAWVYTLEAAGCLWISDASGLSRCPL